MESNTPEKKPNPVSVDACQNGGRRKLIKKAGMAAPAFLVLANRPVLASTCNPSGFISANMGTSLPPAESGSCGDTSWGPTEWIDAPDDVWALTGVDKDSRFSEYFDTAQFPSDIYIKKTNSQGSPVGQPISAVSSYTGTILDALQLSTDPDDMIKNAAAALLNALLATTYASEDYAPDWMNFYPIPEDFIGLYLLYELRFIPTPPPTPSDYAYIKPSAAISTYTRTASNFVSLFNFVAKL